MPALVSSKKAIKAKGSIKDPNLLNKKSTKIPMSRTRSKRDRLIASIRRLDQGPTQAVEKPASCSSFGEDCLGSARGDDASLSPGQEGCNNQISSFSDPVLTESLHSKVQMSKKSDNLSERVEPGVIYLGHIPFGFFEEEMKKFFSQFGKVNRLRLSRSKKTGASRSYAFVEFEDREVAAIVAETMNDYLMYGRRLKSVVIPAEKVHPNTFFGRKKFLVHDTVAEHRIVHNAPRTDEQLEKNVKRLVRKEEEHKKKLREMGIDYEFVGYASMS